MNRSWIYVFVGGLIEVVWVSGLKHADSILAWAVTVLAVVVSFYLIMKARSVACRHGICCIYWTRDRGNGRRRNAAIRGTVSMVQNAVNRPFAGRCGRYEVSYRP